MISVYIALATLIVWVIVLSFFVFKIRKHYFSLTQRTGAKNIDNILDTMMQKGDVHDKSINELQDSLSSFIKQSESFYQKIGFIKFNPFDRVAGEQSFVIALLDKNNNGIVKTFLYTREGVRIYVKQIKGGKAIEYELSDEEKQAISKAQ